MKQLTMAQIKAIDPQWFTKESMDFFNTVVEATPNKDNLFITSERPDLNSPKAYSIRCLTEKGFIDTFGGFANFGKYKTLDEARQARSLANGGTN